MAVLKAKCQYCGEIDELRPYGSNGENICFKCGMKPENKAATEQQYQMHLDKAMAGGSNVVILGDGPPRAYVPEPTHIMCKPLR